MKIIDEECTKKFENEIETNPLWVKELGSEIISILPIFAKIEIESFNYYVFYNITTDEYNTYPLDGEHDCTLIAYNSELKKVAIYYDFKINLD